MTQDISEIADRWSLLAPRDNLFLQPSYLQCVQESPPPHMRFLYQLCLSGGEPIGIAYYQVRNFNAAQSIRDQEERRWWQMPLQYARRLLASAISFNTLIAGNLMLTGQHFAHFAYPLSKEAEGHLQMAAIREAKRFLAKKGIGTPLTFVKDFYPGHAWPQAAAHQAGYHDFSVQPNMVMELDPSWRALGDYLEALHSKYRVRAKRAFKKSASIGLRKLSPAETRQWLPRIFALYQQTVGNAGFNVVDLNPEYLLGLHSWLGEDYSIYGCFQGDEMVAFFTLIRNYEEMEAHFLGIDAEANRQCQVYLANLFHIIDISIQAGCRRIIFARTALEIKSSVGAEPYWMTCYMQHQSPLLNRGVPSIIRFLYVEERWQQRHPYKDSEAEAGSAAD